MSVTFAIERLHLQGLTPQVLTARWMDDRTGQRAVAVLATWDMDRWVPSAFCIITGLKCPTGGVGPPSTDQEEGERGSMPVLRQVCTEQELLTAFIYFDHAVTWFEGKQE